MRLEGDIEGQPRLEECKEQRNEGRRERPPWRDGRSVHNKRFLLTLVIEGITTSLSLIFTLPIFILSVDSFFCLFCIIIIIIISFFHPSSSDYYSLSFCLLTPIFLCIIIFFAIFLFFSPAYVCFTFIFFFISLQFSCSSLPPTSVFLLSFPHSLS